MAKFTTMKIPKGTPPQTAWAKLRNKLLGAESVEVLLNPSGGFTCRVWMAERADGSNGPNADPTKEY